MKRHLLAALLLGLPLAASAQSSAVPVRISYQGKVTDATGTPVGNTSAVNRVVTFRIWDSPTAVTAANRLYSEQQTVTISAGEFSVLIGAGSAVSGENNLGSLDAIFNGETRFLGITIDDPGVSPDPEISPRQQIVANAFAFRAKVAESLANQSLTSTMIANNAVGTAQVADAAITLGKVATGAVDTTKLTDNAVTGAKIANTTITANKLGADVGLWSVNGANVFRPLGGAVGIGTNVPSGPLDIFDNANPRIGFHTPLSTVNHVRGLFVGLNNGGAAYVFNWENTPLDLGTNGLTRLRINADGYIGLGTAAHANAPSVVTAFTPSNTRVQLQTNKSGTGYPDGAAFGYEDAGSYPTGYVWVYENAALDFATNNILRHRIEPDGRQGWNIGNGDINVSYYFKGLHHTTPGGPVGHHVTFRIVNPDMSEVAAFRADGAAFKSGGTSWFASSDARLKTDIHSLSGSLEKLLQLRSVTFRFKDPARGAGVRTGFIAQEVEKIIPEWVTEDDKGIKAVGYTGFESMAVQALRELRAEKDAGFKARDEQIAALTQRIRDLETKATVAARESTDTAERLAAIERRLSTLSGAAVTANTPRE